MEYKVTVKEREEGRRPVFLNSPRVKEFKEDA
jgi:hypothetical protein